jgi:putative acetyltransferase
MLSIFRTDSTNPDFHTLVKQLDIELAERDGDDHGFYAQYNKIDHIQHVIIIYQNGEAVACGAIKQYAPDIMEVKRMFVPAAYRGQGIASRVLNELEQWSLELGYKQCILETGLKQPEAIRLYEKNHYVKIPNFGQYAGIENSVCFSKLLQ